MAIIVEAEKKPINWLGLLSAVVVVAVLFVGSYYLFFKKPELIELVIPQNYENIKQLSGLNLDSSAVLDSVFFKLPPKQYGTDLGLSVPGRSNPFEPF